MHIYQFLQFSPHPTTGVINIAVIISMQIGEGLGVWGCSCKGIGVMIGGACNFFEFVVNLYKYEPMISRCWSKNKNCKPTKVLFDNLQQVKAISG
jgi:hypothetical protein